MTNMTQIQLPQAIAKETKRIEEDALHSMKGHFNAGSRWSVIHLWIGLPAAILAAWAGIDAFGDRPVMTAILALLSASLVATMTFLGPQQRASEHKNAGREYNVLKNRARKLREIDMLGLGEDDLRQAIDELVDIRDSLNSMSPDIPSWAYEKAKKDIDAGHAEYRTDKVVSDDS